MAQRAGPRREDRRRRRGLRPRRRARRRRRASPGPCRPRPPWSASAAPVAADAAQATALGLAVAICGAGAAAARDDAGGLGRSARTRPARRKACRGVAIARRADALRRELASSSAPRARPSSPCCCAASPTAPRPSRALEDLPGDAPGGLEFSGGRRVGAASARGWATAASGQRYVVALAAAPGGDDAVALGRASTAASRRWTARLAAAAAAAERPPAGPTAATATARPGDFRDPRPAATLAREDRFSGGPRGDSATAALRRRASAEGRAPPAGADAAPDATLVGPPAAGAIFAVESNLDVLDLVLGDAGALWAFERFLDGEFAAEGLRFLAAAALHDGSRDDAARIVASFVRADAASQVNLPQRIVADVERRLREGDLDGLFDDAVHECRALVANDNLQRFLDKAGADRGAALAPKRVRLVERLRTARSSAAKPGRVPAAAAVAVGGGPSRRGGAAAGAAAAARPRPRSSRAPAPSRTSRPGSARAPGWPRRALDAPREPSDPPASVYAALVQREAPRPVAVIPPGKAV
ncbi:tRNA-Phe hydroxylase [Aureococcus anophagefferens]|nr:tRNA-Phe hydroxylase [Aureococcus anophagefferens]